MKKIGLLLLTVFICLQLFSVKHSKTRPNRLNNIKSYYKSAILYSDKNNLIISPNRKSDFNATIILNNNSSDLLKNNYSAFNDHIVLACSDTVYFKNLSPAEISGLADELNKFVYTLKLIGTNDYSAFSYPKNVMTFLKIYDDQQTSNYKYDNFTPALSLIHNIWKNNIIYLKFEPIKKMNMHNELSISVLSENRDDLRKDFAEINLHFNLANKIDLIFVKIYKNIKE